MYGVSSSSVLYQDEELRQADTHIVIPRSTFTILEEPTFTSTFLLFLNSQNSDAEEFHGNETSRWSLWSIWQPMNWTRLPLKKPHQGWNYHKETWLDALGAKIRENKCKCAIGNNICLKINGSLRKLGHCCTCIAIFPIVAQCVRAWFSAKQTWISLLERVRI